MSTPSAAIVISTRIGVGAVEPYVSELTRLGYHVRIYCLGGFEDTARTIGPEGLHQVFGPEDLPEPWWARPYSRAISLLSKLQPGLNPDQRQVWSHRSRPGRSVRRSTRWLLARFEARTVNRWLSAAAALARTRFSEDVVVVVTTSSRPWIHAAGRPPTISIIESWDHPIRKTAGYRTDVVIAWNEAIKRDWMRYQGAGKALVGGPWKLSYAIDAFPLAKATIHGRRRRLLYAVGASSSNLYWYEAECRLVELVAQAAEDAGWDVTLKLKPNGGPMDFVEVAARFPHVRLTNERSSPNPMDYHLSDIYNQQRLGELGNVDLVVNAVTTFALDAACAGVPVLQLSGFEGAALAGIRSASSNYHIQTYLMNEPRQVLTADSSNLRDELSAWLGEPDCRAVEFSTRLRNWLVPEEGLAPAMRHAISEALRELGLPADPHGAAGGPA